MSSNLGDLGEWTFASDLQPGDTVRRLYEGGMRTVKKVLDRGASVVLTFTDGSVEESSESFVWTFTPLKGRAWYAAHFGEERAQHLFGPNKEG